MTRPSFTLWSIGNKIDESAGRLATIRRSINLGYETNISAEAESLLDLVQMAMEREEENLARLSEAMMEILRNQRPLDIDPETATKNDFQWNFLSEEDIVETWKKTDQLIGFYTYKAIAEEVNAKLKEMNT